ncbi:glycosyltransferase [Pseudomonas saudiphocaensis]|uniref:glycosyltransferase n=1 Tax=Pseudomonas saudiphocaensis TaxID=1499686 RepID=UPI000F789469|nr:glycosyltransferase [Pseudomonas saudiphocaensis]RRV13650.1 glycosyltransferase [Pseudomonas saudiphocaensis]
MILHLINNSQENAGGAQKILWAIYRHMPAQSSIFSFTQYISFAKNTEHKKIFYILKLFGIVIKSRPRLVVIHHRRFLLFQPLFKVLGIRSVFLCHNVFPDHHLAERIFKANKAIAISTPTKVYLEYIGYSDIVLIENFIDFPAHPKLPRPLAKKIVDIAYVGRLEHQKGVDLLLDSFLTLPREKLNLHIIGAGRLEESLKSKAKHNPRVRFYGSQSDPFKLVAEFDMLIVPSRWEGFGLVFYEAIANKHFVIASDIDAFKLINTVASQVVYVDIGKGSGALRKAMLEALDNNKYLSYAPVDVSEFERFSKITQLKKYEKLLCS